MQHTNNQYISLPYRPGVGIMLLNRDNEVFVGRRIDTRSEAWQMPQGGIDENEQPHQAAMRELFEETGVAKAKIIAESKEWFYYDLPDYLIPKLWNGKYRGQKQKWFALRFLGNDTEIDIHKKNAEFMSWRWASLEDLPDIIVPFKRKLYTAVVSEFRDSIFSDTSF